VSNKKPTPKEPSRSSDQKTKEESLDRLIQQYHQAKADGDTPQIKRLESILKRLGYTKFK
jgi:hypothetical protein